MPTELVSFTRTLNRLGIEPDTDDAAHALALLRAVSAEVSAKTHRDFPTADTFYEDVIDAKGLDTVILKHAPVADLLSVNRVYTDGTNETIDTPSRYEWDGVMSWTHPLAAGVTIGDTTLEVSDSTGMAQGDHMLIADDEVVRITNVAGTTITFAPAARFTNAAGAVYHVSGSVSWYLDDAERGKVRLAPGRRLLRFIYRVAGGTVPLDLQEAVLDYVESEWTAQGRSAGLTSYSTGDDSENYDVMLSGNPPPRAARTLARYWRRVRNGVV